MKDLKFIVRYAKPAQWKVFAIFLDVLIYVSGLLAAPLILSYMIDNIIQGIPLQEGIVLNLINMLGGVEYLRANLWIGGVLVLAAYALVGFGIHRRAKNCGILSETFSENLHKTDSRTIQNFLLKFHNHNPNLSNQKLLQAVQPLHLYSSNLYNHYQHSKVLHTFLEPLYFLFP